jgi:ribonuclease VapC
VTGWVLDASALLALLLRERGGDKVAPVLTDAAISTLNLSEVVSYFARSGSPPEAIHELLGTLELECVPFDDDLAYAAGMLITTTRAAGLSLADRACLVLARRLGAKVLTGDRAWARVADAVGVEVELIR